MESNIITFFDLFAGIGGFRLALEKLGWKCIGYCEIDKYATATYRANFETTNERYYSDARHIDAEKLPDFDVLVAGFPCQAFSLAGDRLGFDDARGTLFFDIARIIEKKQPKAFILENVKGLVYHKKGRTLKTIFNILSKLGYDVYFKILDSKNFGVPQSRERIFFVGFKINNEIKFSFPEGYNSDKTLIDIIKMDVPEKYYLCRDMTDKFLLHKSSGNGSTEIVLLAHTKANIRKRRQKRDISWTIDTSGNKMGVVFGTRIRRLTPRECARLQGFPDSFRFPVSDTQAYKQIGNAVTVNVVEAIGKNLSIWIWFIDYLKTKE